jgi:hypothetical protein
MHICKSCWVLHTDFCELSICWLNCLDEIPKLSISTPLDRASHSTPNPCLRNCIYNSCKERLNLLRTGNKLRLQWRWRQVQFPGDNLPLPAHMRMSLVPHDIVQWVSILAYDGRAKSQALIGYFANYILYNAPAYKYMHPCTGNGYRHHEQYHWLPLATFGRFISCYGCMFDLEDFQSE